MIIFSIKDKAVGFTQVFTAQNKFVAIRMLKDTVEGNQDTLIAKHPEEFTLYQLGEFNEETGAITPKIEKLEEAKTFASKTK